MWVLNCVRRVGGILSVPAVLDQLYRKSIDSIVATKPFFTQILARTEDFIILGGLLKFLSAQLRGWRQSIRATCHNDSLF